MNFIPILGVILGLNYQSGIWSEYPIWDEKPQTKKTSTPIWKAKLVSKISKLGTSRLLCVDCLLSILK